MRRWHTCFFILLFCGFSGNVLCKESINEAIERLYQPLTSNDDIPITDEFSLDLRSNMSATPGKMTPWLNNNLLCRCVDDAFVSAEIIQSTHLNGGRTHVLLQLVIKQNRTDIGFAPIFPDICYHLTHYKPAAADIPVASDNPAHYADAIR
ncbi:hypothetical protein ACVODF_16985, partial [Shigella flexneri]